MPQKPGPANEELKLSTFAGVGLQFAVAIVLFVLLGQWADRKLGTTPVFLIIGVIAGGGGAFYSLYRRISIAQKADDERRKRQQQGEKK